LLEKDALIRMAQVYMENPEETVAIGGNVRIANGCLIEDGIVKKVRLPDKLLPMFQTIEYMKAFLGGRIGWSSINGLIIVSGAFGLFRKDCVIKVGGYREGYPRRGHEHHH
jgi:cellulose synthase/poly-beta-1,6-N-acetylglucosamine synthase-like glycosyltransferase